MVLLITCQLMEILRDTHELHLRFSSPDRNARSLPPLVSRVPAGLHVFFTPRKESKGVPVCRLVNDLLGSADGERKCVSVEESFSRPHVLSERFAGTASWQYFSPGMQGAEKMIGTWVLGKACPNEKGEDGRCWGKFKRLEEAIYVDLDFDAIAQTATITGVWSPFSSNGRANGEVEPIGRVIRKYRESDRVEVGALQVEESEDDEELALGGFLTVLGEDEKPGLSSLSEC